MFCKNCGNQVEDSRFCSICGAEQAAEAAPVVETTTQPEVVAVDPGKGLGITALILGIAAAVLAIPCTCLSCAFLIPLALGIAGIVVGAIGIKKSKDAGFNNKQAKIGLILSIVGIVLVIGFYIAYFVFGIAAGLFAGIAESFSTPSYGYYY